MQFTNAPLLALVASVAAVDPSQWHPAGPGDSRAPCPGLNSMANHGILPHDGKHLSVPMLVDAMKDTFNIAKDLGAVLAIGGLLTSQFPLGLHFDLEDLKKHNFIEHDASLSRADFNEGGDDHTFQQDIFNQYMAFFDGMNETTLETAAHAKFARVQNETETDPNFTYGPLQFVLSYAESALYLKALGNADLEVPIDWVRTFFEQEKLPLDQGWTAPSEEIGFVSANLAIAQLVKAGGEVVPEGLVIGKNTLARALLGLDVLKQDVSDIVKGLLSKFGLGSIFS